MKSNLRKLLLCLLIGTLAFTNTVPSAGNKPRSGHAQGAGGSLKGSQPGLCGASVQAKGLSASSASGTVTDSARADFEAGTGVHLDIATMPGTVRLELRPLPVANAGADQIVSEGSQVTLDGSGSHGLAGNPMSYTWTQTAGPAVLLYTSDPVHPTFVAPDVATDTIVSFKLVVNNGRANSVPDTVDVIIVADNDAPVAHAGLDQTAHEGTGVALDGTASSDANGDPLTFAWAQTRGTAVTLSDPSLPPPTFAAPDVARDERLISELTANGGALDSAPDKVVVLVTADNEPPVADADSDQVVDSGSLVNLNGTGSSDPNGDEVTYSWTQTAGTAVTFTWSNESASGATSYTLDVNGTLYTVSGTSCTINLTSDGIYTWTVQAIDALGNASGYTDTWSLMLDRIPPTVILDAPASGTVLTTTHLPTTVVAGTASDKGSGLARVEVTTGTTWITAVGTDIWTYAWALPIADHQTYTLTARAIDNATNVHPSSDVTVTVDIIAPTAAAPVPDRHPWVASTVVYTWDDSNDGAGIAAYKVRITNTEGYAEAFLVSDPVLTFTQAYSEGVGYRARVRAMDANGNTGPWSDPSIVVTPDRTPPTITSPSIDEDSSFFSVSGLTLFYTNTMSIADTFAVRGNANDTLSGVDKATFSPAFGQTPGDDNYPGIFAGHYDVPAGSTEAGLITATVYDQAGNIATQTYRFELDGTPPDSTAWSPAHVTGSPITVTWVASDTQSGVRSTTLWYMKETTGTWLSYQTVDAASGAFSFAPPDGDGLYLFATVAVDNLGNPEAGPTVSETQTAYRTQLPDVEVHYIYLPLTTRDWTWRHQYDVYEPNDSPAQAYGPLTSGQTYQAYVASASRRSDYYASSNSTSIQNSLTNVPATNDWDYTSATTMPTISW